MVRVDQAIIARLQRKGKTFEVFVDCDAALLYREKKLSSLDEVLATKDIFSDVKKSERAKELDLREVFHTTDPIEIAKEIILHGEIQLTTEHKARLREQKRKQLASFIQRNAVDPASGRPHPQERILMVMDEAHVKIDEFRSVEEQAKEIVVALRTRLPLRIEVRRLRVRIPSQFAGQAHLHVKRFATSILAEEWLGDGSLAFTVEIPAGVQEEFEQDLAGFTKGTYDLDIIDSNRR